MLLVIDEFLCLFFDFFGIGIIRGQFMDNSKRIQTGLIVFIFKLLDSLLVLFGQTTLFFLE